MAFSKARRLSDLISADGTSFISSASITDGVITGADIHSTFDLTGKTVTVATASSGDNDTSAASTAFVQQEIASLVDSAPGTLNTLNELAAALGDDASFSTTVTDSIATKLPLAGGTLTGDLVLKSDGGSDVINVVHSGNTVQLVTIGQSSDNSGNGVIQLKRNNGVLHSQIHSHGSTYFNGGNVGIGIASGTPVSLLEINDNNTTDVTNSATMVAGTSLTINGNSGEGSDVLRMGAMANGTGNYFMEVSNSGGNAQYDLLINPINGGNLGIGTTDPAALLHAAKGTNGSGLIDVARFQNKGTSVNDGARIQLTAGTSTIGAGIGCLGVALNSAHLVFHSGGNNERMRIASDGHTYINNGIGVATRTTMDNQGHNWQGSVYNTLSVGGMAIGTDSSNSSHVWFNMYDTGSKYAVDSGYAMDHYHTNSNGEYVWRQFSNAGSAGASISPIQVFKMNSAGRIGYQKVDPSGDMTIHTGGANGTTTKWRWGSNVSNTHSYWINHNNAGVYMSSGGTSWTAHSDERIKENITDIGSVMDKIKDYRCVTYNRKGMSDTKVGFIAQDWETDFPHVVDEDTGFTIQSDGSLMAVHEEENTSEVKPKSISYTETIPILLKAIQELEARIKVLEG